jgi:hypothetical protein
MSYLNLLNDDIHKQIWKHVFENCLYLIKFNYDRKKWKMEFNWSIWHIVQYQYLITRKETYYDYWHRLQHHYVNQLACDEVYVMSKDQIRNLITDNGKLYTM